MLFSPVFLALLSLAVSVQASPYVLHEKRSHIPAGWAVSRRHDAAEHLPLRFGLRQSNMDQLDAMLMDIADPQSPNVRSRHNQIEAATRPGGLTPAIGECAPREDKRDRYIRVSMGDRRSQGCRPELHRRL